ncbi:hypothetical protein [Archangium violaceum]|uniref:hypothetical protein n=1 Tax=Archangium violaceum TaxID=83451 RepID=UPI0037BF8D86
MTDNAKKEQDIIKKEQPKSLEVVELDDAVLELISGGGGGCNSGGTNCGCSMN